MIFVITSYYVLVIIVFWIKKQKQHQRVLLLKRGREGGHRWLGWAGRVRSGGACSGAG